jgi:hypothetical protein
MHTTGIPPGAERMDAQAPNRLTPHQGMEQAPAHQPEPALQNPTTPVKPETNTRDLDKTRSLLDAVMRR